MQNNTNNHDPLAPQSLRARPLTGRARRLIGGEWRRDRFSDRIDLAAVVRAAATIAACGAREGFTVSLAIGADAAPIDDGAARAPVDIVADLLADYHPEQEENADTAADTLAGLALLRVARYDAAAATHAASEYGIGRTLPPAPARADELAHWLRAAGTAGTLAECAMPEGEMPRAVAALAEAMRARLASQWCAEAAQSTSTLDAVARTVAALAMHPETARAEADPDTLALAQRVYHTARVQPDPYALAAHAGAIALVLAEAHARHTDPQRMPQSADATEAMRRAERDSAQRAESSRAEGERHDREAQRLAELERESRAAERVARDQSRTEPTPAGRAAATRHANRAAETAAAAQRQRERAEQQGREARAQQRAHEQNAVEARERIAAAGAPRAEQEGDGAGNVGAEAFGNGGTGDIGDAIRTGCAQSRTGAPARAEESLAVEVIQ